MGRHLSPSLVISCIALFVALGGVGYAAVELPRNSVGELQLQRGAVGTEELQRDAVNSRKILDGSVHAADLAPGLLAGQQGAKGEKGDPGATSAGAGGGGGLTLRAADGAELGTFVGLLDDRPVDVVVYHGGIFEYDATSGELLSNTIVMWADAACTGSPYADASAFTDPDLIAREVRGTGGARRFIANRLGGGPAAYRSTGLAAHPVGRFSYVDSTGACILGWFDFYASHTYVELEPAPTPPSPAALPLTLD